MITRRPWRDSDYDALMDRARRLPDIKARNDLMQRAEASALAQFPVLPLWSIAVKRLVNPALKGWHENNRDVHAVRYLSW